MTTLNTVKTNYTLADDGKYTAKNTQHISQAFLDDLKDARNESTTRLEGDMMRVASIPVAVIEQWDREGFSIYEHTGPEIIKRLSDQNLQSFLTTDKRV
jgi:hypothetical protein